MREKLRTWAEWAVDHIKATGRCPGDTPPIGEPEDRMTLETFQSMMKRVEMHDHDGCTHLYDEVLGVPVPGEMKELPSMEAAPVTEEDVKKGKRIFDPKAPSVRLDKFKRELHTYVDMVEFREGGKLYIPDQLLRFDNFLKTYFEVQAG